MIGVCDYLDKYHLDYRSTKCSLILLLIFMQTFWNSFADPQQRFPEDFYGGAFASKRPSISSSSKPTNSDFDIGLDIKDTSGFGFNKPEPSSLSSLPEDSINTDGMRSLTNPFFRMVNPSIARHYGTVYSAIDNKGLPVVYSLLT